MKKLLLSGLVVLTCSLLKAQHNNLKFPQDKLNQTTQQAIAKYPQFNKNNFNRQLTTTSPKSVLGVLKKIEELKQHSLQKPMSSNWLQLGDTIIVGYTPNDTLRITGNWTHNGPIFVLGDGVLIFKNATVIDTGDVYVFQSGKLFADSSSLTFPQQYFYQRSLIVVQNGFMQLQNCSLNYSGLSHNLVLGDSAQVTMNNIHQNDWTTCGLFSRPTLNINGCNLAGEYIMTDSSKAIFKNTDTLLLWHHFPGGANIAYDFPDGDTVYNYNFNNGVSGVGGIKWDLSADTCHNIMWALMPENNTNVVISNSVIRAIGTWFKYADTVNVSGLNDNSSYVNFTAPLADRNLQLINTDVQTWSLYVFDKSHIDVANCTVGEVGTQQRATVTQTNPFLLDGSGGYYWCTDTSAVISFGAVVYSYVRSEKNGIFIFAYGWQPFSAPQAIGKSLLVCVQSNSPVDPVMYDAATVWMDKIDGPDTAYTNMTIPVIGSAWIDWAGSGGPSWMDFASYSVYYQLQGSSTWTRIVKDSLFEFHHAPVANWNTLGLPAGNHLLKLTVKNNFGDTVEAVKPITLLVGTVGVPSIVSTEGAVKLFPNPNNGMFTIELKEYENSMVEIYNSIGQKILVQPLRDKSTQINFADFNAGVYQVRVMKNKNLVYQSRVVKE